MTLLRQEGGGLSVALRVQPGAARDMIEGVVQRPDGPRLKLAVTAPAERGRANGAALRLLARAWRLPPTRLALTRGSGSRDKTVLLAEADPATRARLVRWFAQLPARPER